MNAPNIGTRDEWFEARTKLLDREKDLNRQRDELAEQRRQLPWVRIDKSYRFEGPDGELTLPDLFDERSQLLAHRDVCFVCVARAPYSELAAYKARMGWTSPGTHRRRVTSTPTWACPSHLNSRSTAAPTTDSTHDQ